MTSASDDSSRPGAKANDRPTTDMLRDAIDRGEAGDKVNNPDPAAAPLGTDAEAGGAPATSAEVDMASRHEVRQPPQASGSQIEPRNQTASGGFAALGPQPVIWIGVGFVVLLVLAALLLG